MSKGNMMRQPETIKDKNMIKQLLLRILAVIGTYGPQLMTVMIFVTQNNFKSSRNFWPSPWILPSNFFVAPWNTRIKNKQAKVQFWAMRHDPCHGLCCRKQPNGRRRESAWCRRKKRPGYDSFRRTWRSECGRSTRASANSRWRKTTNM